MATEADLLALVLQQRLLARALTANDFGGLHLHFDITVLDRYRERGATLVRTRTVGRVSLPGRWSLDLGIAPSERAVHLPAADLLERLPAEEHAHWVAHFVTAPASERFIQMRMTTAACIDDGDAVPWEAPTARASRTSRAT